MPRHAGPKPEGPSPTPITEYLHKHPEASMMSIAKASGLNYDTVHKAERGLAPPMFVTLLKLQRGVGIPVMAWAGTKAVRIAMEQNANQQAYRDKAERWRAKKMRTDPIFRAKEQAKFKRRDERLRLKKAGLPVPPVPMSPMKARLKGLPVGTLETSAMNLGQAIRQQIEAETRIKMAVETHDAARA